MVCWLFAIAFADVFWFLGLVVTLLSPETLAHGTCTTTTTKS